MRYYFEIEKRLDNLLTFAYIYREQDDHTTAPPAKSFYSAMGGEEAKAKVSRQATAWISERGTVVAK